MLRSVEDLRHYGLEVRHGDIGKIEDVLFDDQDWVVRYFVVDTHRWLPGRRVLIAPVNVEEISSTRRLLLLHLTKEQVRSSPPLDTHPPVSREMERRIHEHFGWTPYWGYDLGGVPPIPGVPAITPELAESAASTPPDPPLQEAHLRSMTHVMGYGLRSRDGEDFGKAEDMIADDVSWQVRYLVTRTGAWFGRSVVIAPAWIDHIDWADALIHLDLRRKRSGRVRRSTLASPSTVSMRSGSTTTTAARATGRGRGSAPRPTGRNTHVRQRH